MSEQIIIDGELTKVRETITQLTDDLQKQIDGLYKKIEAISPSADSLPSMTEYVTKVGLQEKIEEVNSKLSKQKSSIDVDIEALETTCDTLRVQLNGLDKKIKAISPSADSSPSLKKYLDKVEDLQKQIEEMSSKSSGQKPAKDAEGELLRKKYDDLDKSVTRLQQTIGTALSSGASGQAPIAQDVDIVYLRARNEYLSNQIRELGDKLNDLQQQIQESSKSNGQKPARGEVIESLEKKCETLCGLYDELKAKIEKLPQDDLRSRMDKAKGKCRTIFLCAIVFFCATVAGCVICCPGYFGGVVSLPWYGIVTLITCTLLDIVGTCVWLCDYYSSAKRYSKTGNIVFTFVVEVIVMVLTVLAMWFFCYHPLTEVRGAAIWLTVLLGCANLVIFVLRLMYLIWDHSYVYIDFKSFGFCAQLCGVAFAVGSAIALIVAMVA